MVADSMSPVGGATTTSNVIAGKVCFQEAAKPISTAVIWGALLPFEGGKPRSPMGQTFAFASGECA
jgi:hypothetical protein